MSDSPNYPAEKLLQLAHDSLLRDSPAEAEAHFQRVLAHEPANAAALHQLGLLSVKRQPRSEAESHLKQVLESDPGNLELLAAYGQLLHEISRPREALDIFLRALSIDSSHAEVWNAAGICFQETARPVEAVEFYLHATALKPDYSEAYNNLGVVMSREGDWDGAIEHFKQALNTNPDYADCHSNLGVALRSRLRYAEAIASFREAYRLEPNNAEVAGAFGEALGLIYDGQAEDVLRRSVELNPNDPEKHWNLALGLLKLGKYPEGWKEHEWRWQRTQKQTPLPVFQQPYWRGGQDQDLRGATILLHAEQGFGDTLQFLRYVPLLIERGAKVLLQVQPALQRLAAELAKQFDGAVTLAEVGQPMPDFDWHIPLISLPHAFGTTLETIPPPRRFTATKTEALPSAHGTPLRVGLAWAGNPLHERDRERSLSLEMLRPILAQSECTWVCLQTGAAAAEIQKPSMEMEQPPLHDFLDTAAIIDTLDIVITVDTAIAHLASAQGVRTWILLPFVADWRWLRPSLDTKETMTNPWYPEAQIFRQTRLPSGEPQHTLWAPVIANVASALRAAVEQRKNAASRALP